MVAARSTVNGMLTEEQRLLEVRREARAAARRATDPNPRTALALGISLFGAAAWVFYAAIRADLRNRISEATAQAELVRRQSEAEAQRVGALVKVIGDVTPALLYAKDAQGRLTYGNPSMFTVLGKSPEEALGKTDAEFAPDRAQGEIISGNDLRIMASGEVETVDEVFTGPDQTTRVLRSTKTPLRDAQGDASSAWPGSDD